MKSTGIVRKVDELGRVVIPKEVRRIQNIKEKDPLAIFVEDDKIILQKYEHQKACVITGELIYENKELANGIVLSPAGAKILLNELEDYIDVQMK